MSPTETTTQAQDLLAAIIDTAMTFSHEDFAKVEDRLSEMDDEEDLIELAYILDWVRRDEGM